jgi:arsenate reductase-like glutaredoxin family protein
LNNVKIENLIDKDNKEYNRLSLKYLTHYVEEELLNHPLLYRTPIVRDGRKATVGYVPEVWKEWT